MWTSWHIRAATDRSTCMYLDVRSNDPLRVRIIIVVRPVHELSREERFSLCFDLLKNPSQAKSCSRRKTGAVRTRMARPRRRIACIRMTGKEEKSSKAGLRAKGARKGEERPEEVTKISRSNRNDKSTSRHETREGKRTRKIEEKGWKRKDRLSLLQQDERRGINHPEESLRTNNCRSKLERQFEHEL